MGDEVSAHAPVPTPQQAQATLTLALQAAKQRQLLAEQGFFNHPSRTCDIEQEIHCLSSQTGMPLSAEPVISSQAVPSTRFDTVTSIIEYDAGGITPLAPDALDGLYATFLQRTNHIQEILATHTPEAIVVPIGVQPLIGSNTWQTWLVPNTGLRRRYHLIDVATRKENPRNTIAIENPDALTFTETASYMAAMMRCAGTQFHIAECSVDEALAAHNISIFIAPIMTALFGNSPFVGGIDSGRTCTRMDLLLQGEPARAGIPRPANSLYAYYEHQLTRGSAPFFIDDSAERALTLIHGTIHTTSRIQVDMEQRTIRNEFRCIDSQSPFRSMQAFLLTLGAIDGLRGHTLASYEEAQDNLRKAIWGLHAPMRIQGRTATVLTLARELVDVAMKALHKNGFGRFAHEFLAPLRENELKHARVQADDLRTFTQQEMAQGRSLRDAIVAGMHTWNRKSLEGS